MAFTFRDLEIPGVLLIEPHVVNDLRGFFMETYKRSEFRVAGIPSFVQDNYSSSTHGVLRGLHYQRPPRAQGKLVTVLRGVIFDVVVDLRRDSPAYGRWTGVTLSAANRSMVYVPEGLAHGFCVVGELADVAYKVTAEYAVELEAGVRWNDPSIGIRWPVCNPILSKEDADLPFLRDCECDSARQGTA